MAWPKHSKKLNNELLSTSALSNNGNNDTTVNSTVKGGESAAAAAAAAANAAAAAAVAAANAAMAASAAAAAAAAAAAEEVSSDDDSDDDSCDDSDDDDSSSSSSSSDDSSSSSGDDSSSMSSSSVCKGASSSAINAANAAATAASAAAAAAAAAAEVSSIAMAVDDSDTDCLVPYSTKQKRQNSDASTDSSASVDFPETLHPSSNTSTQRGIKSSNSLRSVPSTCSSLSASTIRSNVSMPSLVVMCHDGNHVDDQNHNSSISSFHSSYHSSFKSKKKISKFRSRFLGNLRSRSSDSQLKHQVNNSFFRKRTKKINTSATKIQALVRGFLCRLSYRAFILTSLVRRINQNREIELNAIEQNKQNIKDEYLDSFRNGNGNIIKTDTNSNIEAQNNQYVSETMNFRRDNLVLRDEIKKLRKASEEMIQKNMGLEKHQTAKTRLQTDLYERERQLLQKKSVLSLEAQQLLSQLDQLRGKMDETERLLSADVKQAKAFRVGVNRIVQLMEERCSDQALLYKLRVMRSFSTRT